MKLKHLILAILPILFLSSCSRKLKEAELKYATLNTSYMELQSRFSACQDSSARYLDRIKGRKRPAKPSFLEYFRGIHLPV